MSFWDEIKRRNVFKVGAAYLIVAWLLAQVASTVAPALALPAWVPPFVLLLLALGFPVALVLAWAYEVTPDGIKRTKTVPLSESIRHLTGQRLNYVVTGLLVLAVGFMAIDDYVLEGGARAPAAPADDGSQASTEADPADPAVRIPVDAAEDAGAGPGAGAGNAAAAGAPLPESVAVLPFNNLSPRVEDAYFAAGIHEEILNQLVKLRSLNVISRTTMQQYAGTTKTIPQIARELSVETIMEGSVRYAGDRVLVTVQLIDTATDAHLWSESYERQLDDIFAIQADIATNVANALEVELSTEEQARLARPPTDSTDAYALYLSARSSMPKATTQGYDEAIEQLERAIEIDPDFALAWALKSSSHTIRRAFDVEDVAAERAAALHAAERAIEIDPDLGIAHEALAFAWSQDGEWVGAEREYRRALALDIEVGDIPSYAVLQLVVGDAAGARRTLEASLATDPLNGVALAFLMVAHELLGNSEMALEVFARGEQLHGNWFGDALRIHLDLGRGDLGYLRRASPGDSALANASSPEAARAILRERYAQATVGTELVAIASWAAYYEEPALALEAARDSIAATNLNFWLLWLPLYDSVRALPEFRALVRDLRLVDYWREFGWPDACRAVGADDLECV